MSDNINNNYSWINHDISENIIQFTQLNDWEKINFFHNISIQITSFVLQYKFSNYPHKMDNDNLLEWICVCTDILNIIDFNICDSYVEDKLTMTKYLFDDSTQYNFITILISEYIEFSIDLKKQLNQIQDYCCIKLHNNISIIDSCINKLVECSNTIQMKKRT